MSSPNLMFKDRDGFYYKYPERDCKRCKKYPCISNMENLLSNFAKYGCVNFEDINVFNICKTK